jgi:hypothetical protein
MPQQRWLPWASLLAVACGAPATPANATDPAALLRTLEQHSCNRCNLQDADLVHADLRDARLQGAQLQRANLSGARLDGADLRHADLSFTSLAGASLQGADLRGAKLNGTDLRNSNLSGALVDPGSLSRSHWQQAQGIATSMHSYAELHNAGVQAAQDGRHPEAERWFSEAIQRLPNAAVSWVARGISRAEQGNLALAAQDLRYAGRLYADLGDHEQAAALSKTADLLVQPKQAPKGGNGIGTQLISGAVAAVQLLAPLAAKTMLPMPF